MRHAGNEVGFHFGQAELPVERPPGGEQSGESNSRRQKDDAAEQPDSLDMARKHEVRIGENNSQGKWHVAAQRRRRKTVRHGGQCSVQWVGARRGIACSRHNSKPICAKLYQARMESLGRSRSKAELFFT